MTDDIRDLLQIASEDAKQLKVRAIERLTKDVPRMSNLLQEFDERLLEYYQHLVQFSNIQLGSQDDRHCTMELLGALKVLRLLYTYIPDFGKVHQVIRLREGDWHKSGKMWKYNKGGLLLPGTGSTLTHYRWEPFQVFIWTATYGIKAWVDTEVENGTRQMLDSEREGKNGTIEDLRRLCTDFTLYGPRKIDKTGISAYNALLFFMLGDSNSETYCTANSQTQSKLLYDRARQLIRQLDPLGKRIRFTATTTNWKDGQIRQAQMWALSAGGKTKDGLFAELCCADEYGSASYVNGKSDMGGLVSVVQSSMGPRREPMTVTTTTAGNITAGPFLDKYTGMKAALAEEVEKTWTQNKDKRLLDASDRWTCLMLEPDEWERDEDYMFTSRCLRRKINPMLGKIVQHSFYENEIASSKLDEQKRVETITKLFNVYQTGKVVAWIKGDRIRPLQVEKRVTDCKYQDGWNTFVGLDFSHGDDLFAITYLSVDMKPTGTMLGRFFADAEAWVLEDTMKKSPNRTIYEKWIEQGWLNVCPGEVFDSMHAMNALAEKTAAGVNLYSIGYDPAQSIQPINQLKAWLQTLNIDAQTIQNMVVPVSQGAMTQNPRIKEIEDMILGQEPWLQFSMNPMWPWQFGNCACELGRNDLRRITKGGPQASAKIDNVAALENAMYCFDLSEGKIV